MEGGEYMKKLFEEFRRDESAVGTIEIVLILVVLIALVLIFKNQLTQLINSIFGSISSKAGSIYSG